MKFGSFLGVKSDKPCPECKQFTYVVKIGSTTSYVCDQSLDHTTLISYFTDVQTRPLMLTKPKTEEDEIKKGEKKETKKKDKKDKNQDLDMANFNEFIETEKKIQEFSCPLCPDADLTSRKAWEIHMEFHNKLEKKKFKS